MTRGAEEESRARRENRRGQAAASRGRESSNRERSEGTMSALRVSGQHQAYARGPGGQDLVWASMCSSENQAALPVAEVDITAELARNLRFEGACDGKTSSSPFPMVYATPDKIP